MNRTRGMGMGHKDGDLMSMAEDMRLTNGVEEQKQGRCIAFINKEHDRKQNRHQGKMKGVWAWATESGCILYAERKKDVSLSFLATSL